MLGKKLKKKRLSLAMTRKDFEKKSGLSERTLRDVEAGNSPTFRTLTKLAKGFDFRKNHRGVIQLIELLYE